MAPSPGLLLTIVCGIVLIAQGCGESRPKTYPVTGTVKFTDGSPVRTGFVELIPASGGPSARGSIQTDGSFSLGTFESSDGALEGDYVALVVQHVRPLTPEAARRLGPEHQQHAGANTVVSLKYSTTKTSDLACQVSPNGENVVELTVEPQASPSTRRVESGS